MRVTKVKVDGAVVSMLRDTEKGYLVLQDSRLMDKEKDKEKTIIELLDKKYKNFKDSVINKTLTKRLSLKDIYTPKMLAEKAQQKGKAFCKWKKKESNKILKNLHDLKHFFDLVIGDAGKRNKAMGVKQGDTACFTRLKKNIQSKDLAYYLNHKFSQSKLTYYTDETKSISQSFQLTDLLIEAWQKETFEDAKCCLQPYIDWVTWFIGRKQTLLTRSILKNHLSVSHLSPRDSVLSMWAEKLIDNPQSMTADFSKLSESFRLSHLISLWNETRESMSYEVTQVAEGEQAALWVKKRFEFNRQLKWRLQRHQSGLYLSLKNQPNWSEVNQYGLEVSKYLARYFPIKKSQRKALTRSEAEYYLSQETCQKTIENQIINAIHQYLIRQGKYLYHGLSNVSSEELQRIKADEAFAFQFINACSFAMNTLRNCIDKTQHGDLLSKEILSATLKKIFSPSNDNIALVKKKLQQIFYGSTASDFEDEGELRDVICGLRSAVSHIRNIVMHAKKESVKQITQIEHYELVTNDAKKANDANDMRAFNESLLCKKFFDAAYQQYSALLAEKFKSARLFDFYSVDNLLALGRQENDCVVFSMSNKPLSFTPGFKKVFKWGAIYQHDADAGLELTHYFKKINYNQTVTDEKEEIAKQQAHYNLLQVIYEHCFIPSFLQDTKQFNCAVQAVLAANQRRAKNKGQKEKWAFKEIPEFSSELYPSPIAYLIQIQKILVEEEMKKREGGRLAEDETGYFQQFLWQLFVKGLDSFLTTETTLHFASRPEYQYQAASTRQDKADQQNTSANQFQEKIKIVSQMSATNSTHIAFWTFCQLLDARHLNELHNQISKYRQVRLNNEEVQNDILSVFQEIISFSLLTADRVSPRWQDIYANQTDCIDAIAPYLLAQSTLLKSAPYVNEDSSPVIFEDIELAKRYGTEALLKRVIQYDDRFKITEKAVAEWKKQQKQVEKFVSRRDRLRQAWLEIKQTKKQADNKIKKWLESQDKPNNRTIGQCYLNTVEWLDRYQWLDNKIHLVHIKRLHHLLITLLGRFAGFIAIWERDLRYLRGYCCTLNKKKPLKKEKQASEQADDITLNVGGEPDWYKDLLYSHFLDPQGTNYKKAESSSHEILANWRDLRNYIAHFNFLTKSDHHTKQPCSLLQLLGAVRHQLRYDRKLSNAVAKSVIDILDREGMVVKFKPLHLTKHQFELEDGYPKPKMLTHLGGIKVALIPENEPETIVTDQVSQEYCDMVRVLLSAPLSDMSSS